MKLTAGSVFILGTLFLGAGGLIGGEIWVYSGSLWLATAGFGLAIALLVIGLRAFLKRAAASLNVRFLGEYGDHLDERDLVEVTDAEESKARVESDAKQRPDQVARSISTMLGSATRAKKR